MVVTVSQYLNARSGEPMVSSPNPFYLDIGASLKITNVVIGEEIDGNNIWYLAEDGYYFWSGGVSEIEFELEELDSSSIDGQGRIGLLAQAKEYYYQKYRAMKGFTGIAIAKKVRNSETKKRLSLTFQVERKSDNAAVPIPAEVMFKGIRISTDIVEATEATFHALPLSGSISRKKRDEWGTCGLKVEGTATNNQGTYLLTNYHVAADDLLYMEQMKYNFSDDTELKECVMPSWMSQGNLAATVGYLYQGRFDQWHDLALVLLYSPTSVSNRRPDNTRCSEHLDIFNDKAFLDKQIGIYGAVTLKATSTIRSVNASKSFKINNRSYMKERLIQVDLCTTYGDSGTAALLNGNVIGIIIGGDDYYSYIIPIGRILNFFNLKLSTS